MKIYMYVESFPGGSTSCRLTKSKVDSVEAPRSNPSYVTGRIRTGVAYYIDTEDLNITGFKCRNNVLVLFMERSDKKDNSTYMISISGGSPYLGTEEGRSYVGIGSTKIFSGNRASEVLEKISKAGTQIFSDEELL